MMETSTKDFVIGLSLAIISCFFIGSSFIIKKLGLLRLRGSTSISAADGGFGYLRDWVWWMGFVTMGLGEASNFAAYAFAPAALVTPLGALSILVSAALAPRFLNEKLNLLGKIGCMLCMLGASIIVIHAPKEGDVKSLEDLNIKILESGFLYYILVVVTLVVYSIKFIVPRYGKTNIAVYLFICSSIGSLSVMCCKGLGLGIRETTSDTEKSFFSLSLTIFALLLLICITIQMNYLNKALDSFSSSLVNPVHYIFFTGFVILASSILFQEWRYISAVDVFATLVGLSVVIIALFMISAFNDLRVNPFELCPSPTREQ